MPRIPNLLILRDNIRKANWHIVTFKFNYNKSNGSITFLGVEGVPITLFGV